MTTIGFASRFVQKLNLLLITKPNASMQTLLSLTMWPFNHILEYLSSKDTEEKDRILNLAKVKNQNMKEKYKGRAEALKLKKNEKYFQNREERKKFRKSN